MKAIPLTQGKVAIVDNEDYDWLSKWKWHAVKIKTKWYAARTGEDKPIYMHREVASVAGIPEVDHRNSDGLNNLRGNLRPATHGQNLKNQRKRESSCSSRFKGVTWDKQRGKWMAKIAVDGKDHFIGRFADETEAASAYDQAAKRLHGEFALTNQ